MAASTKKVRGITIKLDADTQGIAEAYGKLITQVNKAQKALTDVNKLLTDATPEERTKLLTQKEAELTRAIDATSKKLEEEKKWLEELKKKDSTPEVERAQEALERQIIEDTRKLQDFQTELANLGKEDKIGPLRDRVKDLNDKLATSKTRLELINKEINNSKGKDRIEALRKKQEELNTAYGLAKDKLETEQRLLAELDEKDGTPEVRAEQEKLRRQVELDEAEFKDFEAAINNWGSVAKQEALIVAQKFKDFGEDIDALGGRLRTAGGVMTATITTPIVAAGKKLFTLSTDFESAMAKVQSVTLGATATQMDQLAEAAINLSESSKYSASEAADALYYMGLAGWDAAEMMTALPNVLNLAAAGDMDLARASDIVTDYVTAFGLTADESTHLVDVLAQTMANSNTNVDQLGQAFSYVAPVAGALGYTVDDVSHALGIMANNGIKGSKAGTALRMLMSRLAKPTAEVQRAIDQLGLSLSDEQGNMYSFHEVLDQIREAFGDLQIPTEQFKNDLAELDEALENGEVSEEDYQAALEDLMETAYGAAGAEKAKLAATIAGTRAMSGMLAIINATQEDYDSLYETIEDATGATRDIANVMLDTTEGAMAKLKHQLENIGRELGDAMIPLVEKTIDIIKNVANRFKDMSDSTKNTIVTIAGITAAIGPLLLVGGTLLSGVGKLSSAIGSIITMFAMHPVASIIGTVAIALGGVAIAAHNAAEKHKEEISELYGLNVMNEDVLEGINDLKTSYEELEETRNKRLDAANEEISKNEGLLSSLQECVDANGTIIEGMETRAEYITNQLSAAYGIEIDINDGIISKYGEVVEAIQEVIKKQKQKAIITAYEAEYQEALAKSTEASYLAAEAYSAMKTAKDNLTEAEAAYNEEKERQAKWVEGGGDLFEEDTERLNELKMAYEAAKDAVEETTKAYEDASKVNQDYQVIIENYGEVMDAIASGDMERLNYAITKMTNNFKTSRNATREELQQQLFDFQRQYRALKQAVEDGMPGVTQEMVDQMKLLVDNAQAELEGFDFELPVPDPPTPEQLKTTTERAKKLAQAAQDGLYGVSGYDSGAWFAKGFAQGIEDNTQTVTSAARRIALAAKSEPNYVLGINSPSREMAKTGRFFTEGFAIGIADEEKEAINAAAEMARSAMAAVGTPSFGGNWNTPFGGGNVNNTTYGAINVTVNGANTSNADELAQIIADRINREVNHRKLVTA